MIGFSNPGRLLRTVRHLRFRQIRWQIANRVRRHFEDPSVLQKEDPPDYPDTRWGPETQYQPPRQPNPAPDFLRGRFSFLNDARDLGCPPDWKAPGASKLWQYNLHYFDWVWSCSFKEGAKAAVDWIEQHPPQRGAVGWEPYPVSLRVMNWCGWFFCRHGKRTAGDEELAGKIWASLWRQTKWLESHLEFHLLGNHLLENATALCLAGSCFNGNDAARWLETGANLLREELKEQFLPDGMHYERSPMYHARVSYLLQLLNGCGMPKVKSLVRPLLKDTRDALKKLMHPDGEIALFNDAAFGIAPIQGALEGDASCEAPGVWNLPGAGYYGARTADGTYVCIDAGEAGPSYQPGHAHADLFSFELSIRGHRVIVDSGTFDYVNSSMRRWCRSTRAHNTLEIDGRNQSEVWSAFRVGRRASPRRIRWEHFQNRFRLSACHGGYSHLRGSPVHGRGFSWNPEGGELLIVDRVTSRRPQKLRRLFHIHPSCRLSIAGSKSARVVGPAGEMTIEWASGTGRISRGWYCPEFGCRISSRILIIENLFEIKASGPLKTRLRWS